MKTDTLKAKLLNCFFAFTLVFGLCIPSIGSYAYAEPTNEATTDTVGAHVESATPQGENQSNGIGAGDGVNNGTGNTGDTNNLGDGDQDEANTNDADNTANNGETESSDTTETEQAEVATAQADEIMPMAADVTVGSMTISGGTSGVDFRTSTNLVEILTSTPLTLTGSFSGSVQVNAGVNAVLILNGVDITSSTAYYSPINLMTASTARIFLNDGKTNNITAQAAHFCAGIHCGDGSTLYIDDSVANWSGTTHVEVLNGVVDMSATLDNGSTVVKGDPIAKLASGNPGNLVVKGGKGAAAIGSGNRENAGNMIFDGGNITAYAYGGNSANTAANSSDGGGSGTGIGAGSAGGATNTWFNGARIDAYGSYHGAGIGAGWSSPGGGNQQIGAATTAVNSTCGNIYINAGYLRSEGYDHGNAFGGACGTNAKDKIIRITGGTLHPVSKGSTKDIGGASGYTIVTGGSALVSAKTKFDGVGDTAFNTQGITTWDDVVKAGGALPNNDKVFMLTVDLSTSSEKLTNEKLESFKLYIGGEDAHYGAPTEFEDGKLYLWLPEWVAQPNAEKEVRIEMTVRQDDGTTKQIDPLFIAKPSSSDTTQTVKRYIEFDFPEDYAKTLEKDYDGLPFPALTVNAEHPIKIRRDVNGSIIEETLDSPNDVKFKYQMLTQNEAGDWVPTGSESEEGAASLPADTGKFQVTMTSYQYANDPNYKASYWGHQAKGVATINRVPAVLTMEGAEWGYLADNGTWTQITEDSTESGVAGNRLKLQFNIRSANTTATTCAAPTGSFQVSIDGEKVGQPILIPVKPDGSGSVAFTDSSCSTVSWSKIPVESEMGTMEDRNGIKVTYYFDPTNNDALLKALEDASKGGKHTVNIEYIADKNYVVGEDNKYNKDEDDAFIVPVPPTGSIESPDDEIVIVDPDPTPSPGGDDPVDPESKTRIIQRTITVPYSKFHQQSQPDLQDYFDLEIQSSSSAPFTYDSSNPAVAGFVKDDKGNVVLKDNNVGIQVNSCGTSVLTLEQKPNALYTGTKYILTIKVVPDKTLVPFVQIRTVTNNLTHPGMPAAPGDEIEYLVTGLNTTPGSSWQAAKLLDTIDPRLVLKEDSVKLASNYSTPNNTEEATPNYKLGTEAFYEGFDWSTLNYNDLAKDQYDFDKNANKITKGVGSVYGGQSTTLRFVATLQSGTAGRPENPGDPKDIQNEPNGDGGYGKEDSDLVLGEDPTGTTPLPKENIVVVGEPDGPDAPSGDTSDGDDPNPIPPLPIIPKDPILPGTNPTDPDNPDNPDNPGTDPTDPDNPGKVDPDIYVNKTAKNLTHPEGNKALKGDIIEYIITTGNKGKDTCYYWPIIKDELPVGLEPVSGSFKLTHVDGSEEAIADTVYNKQTRTVAVYVDDLYYNEEATLSFQCAVTPEATDIKNTAQVYGTTPSGKWKGEHPTPDPTPEPGKDDTLSYIKFDANGGKNAPEGVEGALGSEITDTFPTTEPTRKGYTFNGWNTAKDGKGTKITDYPAKFDTEHGTIYYYAQWKETYPDVPDPADGDPDPADPTKQAHIAFAANGGTGAPEGISGDTGSVITDTFPTEIPIAPGYKFVGWNTQKDGKGDLVKAYPPNFADTKSTTIYYAQWAKIPEGEPDYDPDAPEEINKDGGDPDPVEKEKQSYVRFSANGGFFNKNIMTQAADDDTASKWSTDGIEGAPYAEVSPEQHQTFPKKEYNPVYRNGYEFEGWFTKRTGGDLVEKFEDKLPGKEAETKYYYAHWKKDPNYQDPDNQAPKPGDPVSPDDEGNYPWEQPGIPEIDTPEPADVGKVMPADPGKDDLRITLSAKNETRTDGYTYVGDEVTYTILIENLSSPEKSWLDVIARADIPEGLKFIPGSVYLTAANGEVIHVDDNVYNDLTRILALNAGDLAGEQTAKVVFKAEVTIEALNKDIGMTSYAYATLPSEFDVNDESYVKPELGSAFVPAEGWEAFAETHVNVFNPEKVYPSEKVSEKIPPLPNTPEEAEQAAKLAKTSDFMGFATLGVGAIAIVAAVALILSRKRIQRNK